MKRWGLTYLTIFLLAALAVAQTAHRIATSVPARTSNPQITSTISGVVGTAGQSLVADEGATIWRVTNPDTLQRLSGYHILAKCRTDAEARTVEIISAKPAKTETRYAVNLGDAAFRR